MRKHIIIHKILNSLGIFDESKIYDTSANVILARYEDGNKSEKECHYSSVIGKMNCLSGKTSPDVPSSMYVCAKYSINPKQSHREAVKISGRYLKKKIDKGLLFTSNGSNWL